MDYSNPLNLIIAGVYFFAVAVITFFSIFAVYAALRYGQNKVFSLVMVVSYLVIFFGVLQHSYQTLGLIQ